MEIIRDKEW